MRLWTLHPRYLDRQGLVALWREALLARAVLGGHTRGYTRHPQLHRFRAHGAPRRAIDAYLAAIHAEAAARGYEFDRRKIGRLVPLAPIPATTGQIAHEWQHLVAKLRARSPAHVERLGAVRVPECHPLFVVVPGPVEPWERVYDAAQKRRAARSGTPAARDESRPAGDPAPPPGAARSRAAATKPTPARSPATVTTRTAARRPAAAAGDHARPDEPSTSRRLNRRR